MNKTNERKRAKADRLLGRIMVMRARRDALQDRIHALESERRAVLASSKEGEQA